MDWTENKIVTKRCFQEGDFVMSESKAIAAYIAAKYDKSGRLYPKDPEHRGAVDQRIHFHDGTFNDRLRAFFVHHMNEAGSAPAEEVTRLKEALGWFEDMVRPTGYAAGTQYVTLESNPHSKYIKSIRTTWHNVRESEKESLNVSYFKCGSPLKADLAFLATYSTIRRTTLSTSEASPAFETSPAFRTSPVSKASPIHVEFPLLEEWHDRVKVAVPNYEKANGEGAGALAKMLLGF